MDLDQLDDGPLPLPPLAGRPQDAAAVLHLPWGARLRGAVMAYLPVLLMALLAAASWWLVKRTPAPVAPEPAGPATHAPDYEMRGFSVQQYTQAGPARGVIEGDVVRHYPDTDSLEIEGVRLRWTDAQGRVLQARAARAVAINATGVVTLEGGAHVSRDADQPGDAPIEFTGERMSFDTRAGRVSSREPVMLRQGAHVFTAAAMTYDHDSRLAELSGGVHGQLQPAQGVPGPR
jgi:lipopolysaccharide export system protein LptC